MAVYQVTQKGKDVGSFVTLLSYWAQLSQPLNFFANFYRKVQMQMLDAERLLELFQTKSSITDCPNALHLEKVEGDIRFENVCFSYDSRKQTISDISFHVPAGSTVAFVGETGGGKTTCLKLLFRFYDVASGSIKIDGHDIRDIKLDSMRDHMGVVPQDPQLFNDTVMNNIRYANFDATDEDVYDACRAASIHDKILSFSDGYNSKVGERGVRLSGGELQRVAIARAILKNPKIILLDEATSMIDMETERQIQDAFKRLSEDRTMLIVAHRLSTIMNADLIIVIKEGSIVEKGSHEELINAKGKYHRLWSKQLKPDAPKPEPERKKPLLIDDLFDSMEETDSETARKNAASSSSSIAPLISGFSPPPNYGYVEPSNYGFAAPSNYGFTGSSIVSFPTQIDIPGFSAKQARNSLRAAAPRPAVTFSLPERTVWNPQIHYLPTHNPRITAPNHGILKNVKSFQGPVEIHENPEPLYIGKSGSCRLKADAKEFVPKGLFTDRQHKFQTWPQVMGATPQVTIPVHTPITAATAYIPRITAPVADSTKIADNMSALFEKPPVVSAVQTPECLAQEAPVDPTVPDKIEISNGTVVLAEVDRTALEALGDAQASGSEDVGNADVETDNPQDTQRKRRKRSRRKIKSRTSEAENSEHTQTWNSDDKAADATPAGSFEPQQTAATGKEEAGSLNGNISKAKRRFRSGYKHKGNESEADSEVSAPPAPLSSTENGTRQINGKPKSGPPSRIASKKEDQAPGSSLPKRSESVPTGVTKRDGTHQRKSSVSGKGSWRGPRKPKSITESGISTSEA